MSATAPVRPLPATETLPLRTDAVGLRQALAFTAVYRRVEGDPAPLREAACPAAQFPEILLPIEEASPWPTASDAEARAWLDALAARGCSARLG